MIWSCQPIETFGVLHQISKVLYNQCGKTSHQQWKLSFQSWAFFNSIVCYKLVHIWSPDHTCATHTASHNKHTHAVQTEVTTKQQKMYIHTDVPSTMLLWIQTIQKHINNYHLKCYMSLVENKVTYEKWKMTREEFLTGNYFTSFGRAAFLPNIFCNSWVLFISASPCLMK